MKSILEKRPALTYAVNQVAEVAGYLWQKGWAERNGGNITLNITEFVDDEIKELPHLISLSKRMMKTIKLNLTFSMGLNFLAILLAIKLPARLVRVLGVLLFVEEQGVPTADGKDAV